MARTELLGLDRLIQTCERLGLDVETTPPGHAPPPPGTRVGDLTLDPQLAALYARMGKGVFATHETGLILFRVDDSANELEEKNAWWREDWQPELALPLLVFGGEQLMACYYATVPGMADEQGLQPVVLVNCYEEPHALPLASSVDRFFNLYSRYLEALLAQPDHAEHGPSSLSFPWRTEHLLTPDTRLVSLMREGRFDPLLPRNDFARQWVARVLEAAARR